VECFFQLVWFGVGYALGGCKSSAKLVVGGRPGSAVVWKMVPLCIIWCLWSERNVRFFEDTERSMVHLLHFFLTTLFTWMEAWLALLVISFYDFLSSLAPLGVLLYTSCVLGLRPFVRFCIKHFLLKKK
jgi:hypothetical protein